MNSQHLLYAVLYPFTTGMGLGEEKQDRSFYQHLLLSGLLLWDKYMFHGFLPS